MRDKTKYSEEAMFPELITELLQDGCKVSFSAPGHSMYPTTMANETILVEPIDPETVKQGDIILCRTNGRLVAHRVVGINMIVDSSGLSLSDFGAQSSALFVSLFCAVTLHRLAMNRLIRSDIRKSCFRRTQRVQRRFLLLGSQIGLPGASLDFAW